MHASPTGFLNTKRRVIYRTASGKYYAKAEGGKPVYNPKAKYHKSPGGTERATKYVKNMLSIPSPIRPKFDRKERMNVGAKRAPYKPRVRGVRVLPVKRKAYIAEMFEGHPAKRGRGRPRKVRLVSPGGNMGLAKMFGERKRGRPKKMLYRIKLGGVRVA
jgi:AT hook motif